MSSESWITRWENLIGRGDLENLGPKGREYFYDNYGTDVPGGGGGGRGFDDGFDDGGDEERDTDADGEY